MYLSQKQKFLFRKKKFTQNIYVLGPTYKLLSEKYFPRFFIFLFCLLWFFRFSLTSFSSFITFPKFLMLMKVKIFLLRPISFYYYFFWGKGKTFIAILMERNLSGLSLLPKKKKNIFRI